MILSITSALSLFLLIALSTGIYFAAKKIKIPYTVALVAVGCILALLVDLPFINPILGFLKDMVLTPEWLFYIFLPVLIFETAYNFNIRRMVENAWSISLLAFVSCFLSTMMIGFGLYYILPLVGLNVPLIITLLFGALISPTDPVAVIALFKEYNAPKRLSMIFEGESLINDGAAVAIFMIILSIALHGYHGVETIAEGVFDFIMMVGLGVVLGLAIAALFSKVVRYTRKHEIVSITLLLVSAHITFIFTELINESGIVHISPLISTTIAALFLGNYTRNIMPPSSEHYMHNVLEHTAFIVNSLVFMMAGLLFASSDIHLNMLWLPILIAVGVVATVRAISVYAVTTPIKIFKIGGGIEPAWERLLAWASLRGAISIIVIFLIPKDLTVPGWSFDFTPHEFLTALTVGCILTTLFIKAPTIGYLMNKWNVKDESPLKLAHEVDLAVYYLLNEKRRLNEYLEKGYIDEGQFEEMLAKVNDSLQQAFESRDALVKANGMGVFEQSLHLSMIHSEMHELKRLYNKEEVSESTYRRLISKLQLQQEKVEQGEHDTIDPRVYIDPKDVFEHMANFFRGLFNRDANELTIPQRYEYYRAQTIMARKSLNAIKHIQTCNGQPLYLDEIFERVRKRYKTYQINSTRKAEVLLEENRELLMPHIKYLADRSLASSGEHAMHYLSNHGLVNRHTVHDMLTRYCGSQNITITDMH